jgi:hypothetical protein
MFDGPGLAAAGVGGAAGGSEGGGGGSGGCMPGISTRGGMAGSGTV